MRRFITATLLALGIAVSIGCSAAAMPNRSVYAAEEQDITVENEADVAAWEKIDADSASTVSLVNTESQEGVLLETEEKSGEVLAFRYTQAISAEECMLDFFVDAQNLAENSTVSLRFKDKSDPETELYRIELVLSEDSYQAELYSGELTAGLKNVKYGDNGRIQVRLAKDDVENFMTAQSEPSWNFVAGCDRSSNKQANQFVDSDFVAMHEYLEQVLVGKDLLLEVSLHTDGVGQNAASVLFRQIGYDNFYDIYVFPAPKQPIGEGVYYSRISLTWELPDIEEFPRGAFVVERYAGDRLEKTYRFANAYAATLTDSNLAQATTYTYEISALEQVDTVSNKIACSNVLFRYHSVTVTTMQGDPTLFLIILSCSLLVVCGLILLYVFRFDVERFFKKLFRASKNKNSV